MLRLLSVFPPLTLAVNRPKRRPTDKSAKLSRWGKIVGSKVLSFFLFQDIECRIVNIEKYGKHHQKKICNEVGRYF